MLKQITMGDRKDLLSAEAVAEIKKLTEEIGICMMCTYVGGKLHSRPMSTQQVDEEGNIWFLSDKTSAKHREIEINNTVDLLYAGSYDKFLSLCGTATVLYDRNKIKELYKPIVKVWMPGGEDDPNLSIIKVAVNDGYYWDVKHNKMVEVAKMAVSLVTGQAMDDGIEGRINI